MMHLIFRIFVLLLMAAATSSALAVEIDFNRDIRPILSENCFYCHGQDGNHREAGLRLDVRSEAIDFGAIEPGDAESSELVARIMADDDSLMPPAKSNRVLSDTQKQLIADWIDQGAKYDNHWAFLTPTRPQVPEVADPNWVRNPIDAFVFAKLAEKGLSPSPEADRRTLIKRLYADLIGLPPTAAEVSEFESDPSPTAYEKVVDRLLASRHYGERMALPWLDAARFADSNGFQQDGDTWQWMWRDWLVQALNDDLPFDKFTTWSLAGDLLPSATTEQKIASAFNRNHMLNGEGGAIPEEQRWVNLFDRVDTTATTWLGLTMACAQCHDHKYDPITQVDYYSMLDSFNRVPEKGTPQEISKRIRLSRPFIELPTEENLKTTALLQEQIAALEPDIQRVADPAYIGWKAAITRDRIIQADAPVFAKAPQELKDLLALDQNSCTEEQKLALDKDLRKFFDDSVLPTLDDLPGVKQWNQLKTELAQYKAEHIPRLMVMSDEQPRETHVLSRGEYLAPLDKVEFNTPSFLPSLPTDAPRNRLGFAQWLVSDEHPLTARVQVNRMWAHFFGLGIVKTSEDFGVQSEYPQHLDLLNWLAVEFRECGWSVKRMHRLIVTSSTYRQSSRVSGESMANDPENRLYGRAARFRMPSMILRDWALGSSGLLNRDVGGPPVYPYQPEAVWDALAVTTERDFTYPLSQGEDLYRRSLYTFWRRTVGPANMFDMSDRQTCRVRSAMTSTPLHALTTLNDITWVEAARVLAENASHSKQTPPDRISHAFEAVLCRRPTDFEMQRLTNGFEIQKNHYAAHLDEAEQLLSVGQAKRDLSISPADHAALTVVCLTIYNLDEALTRQ